LPGEIKKTQSRSANHLNITFGYGVKNMARFEVCISKHPSILSYLIKVEACKNGTH
jgi:hypothetical protein